MGRRAAGGSAQTEDTHRSQGVLSTTTAELTAKVDWPRPEAAGEGPSTDVRSIPDTGRQRREGALRDPEAAKLRGRVYQGGDSAPISAPSCASAQERSRRTPLNQTLSARVGTATQRRSKDPLVAGAGRLHGPPERRPLIAFDDFGQTRDGPSLVPERPGKEVQLLR
jgi:hypothetical protein